MPFFLGSLARKAATKAAGSLKKTVNTIKRTASKARGFFTGKVERFSGNKSESFRNVRSDESVSDDERKQRLEHLFYGVTNPIWDDMPRRLNENGDLVIDKRGINERIMNEFNVKSLDDAYDAVENELGVSFDDLIGNDWENLYNQIIEQGLDIFTSRKVRSDASLKLDDYLRF